MADTFKKGSRTINKRKIQKTSTSKAVIKKAVKKAIVKKATVKKAAVKKTIARKTLTKAILKKAASKGLKQAATKTMQVMGENLVVVKGWVVKKHADGNTEKIKKLNKASAFRLD